MKITSKAQRVFYALILLVLSINIFTDDISIWTTQSSLGVSYWIINLIIFTPFLYQLIFNNLFGWFILAFLGLMHLIFTTNNLINIDNHQAFIIIIPMYFIIGVIFYIL